MTRRADRLFQIAELLRGRRLTTAQQLADWLSVSPRTVYRDARPPTVRGADRRRSRHRLPAEPQRQPAAAHVHGRGAGGARHRRTHARNGRCALRERRALGAREDRVGDAGRQAHGARPPARVRAVVPHRRDVLRESRRDPPGHRHAPRRQLRLPRPARRAFATPRVAAQPSTGAGAGRSARGAAARRFRTSTSRGWATSPCTSSFRTWKGGGSPTTCGSRKRRCADASTAVRGASPLSMFRPPSGARPYPPNTTVRFGRSSTCSENTSGRA